MGAAADFAPNARFDHRTYLAANRFVLAGGRDHVDPAVDRIVIRAHLPDGWDATGLLARAAVVDGDAVISFGAGHSVSLTGVLLAALRAGSLAIE